MGKKMTGSNSTGPTKAGKKAGAYIAPPAPIADNTAARMQGEQQFVRDSNRRLSPLPIVDLPFVELAIAFGLNPKRGRSLDTGYRWDATRNRVVVPDGEFTNGY